MLEGLDIVLRPFLLWRCLRNVHLACCCPPQNVWMDRKLSWDCPYLKAAFPMCIKHDLLSLKRIRVIKFIAPMLKLQGYLRSYYTLHKHIIPTTT